MMTAATARTILNRINHPPFLIILHPIAFEYLYICVCLQLTLLDIYIILYSTAGCRAATMDFFVAGVPHG